MAIIEWKKMPLTNVADLIMGQSPPSESYNSDGIGLPFFQGKTDFGQYHPTIKLWCSNPKRIALKNDILMSVRAPVGPTNISNIECCIGRGLAAIRPKENLDYKFLSYFFRSVEPKIENLGSGSTFKAITKNTLANLQIPLPDLPTQKHIAAVLDEADRVRTLLRETLAVYDALVQSVFLEMFGDVVKNDKQWPLQRFSEFSTSRLGKMLDKKFQTGNYKRKYLRNANVLWREFDLADLSEMDFSPEDRETFSLRNNDIIMCEGGEVGRCAIWRGQMKDCYYQKAIHRIRLDFQKARPEYIVEVMWNYAKYGGFDKIKTTSTISHLTGVKLKALNVPIPPISLQNKFAEIENQIQAQKAQTEAQLRAAEDLYAGLLQGYFG